MVEEGFEVLVCWFEVKLFFVVIANDHNFEEFWVNVAGERLYLVLFVEVDDVRPLKSEGLVF